MEVPAAAVVVDSEVLAAAAVHLAAAEPVVGGNIFVVLF